MRENKSYIQKVIESNVTSGRGYDRNNISQIPEDLMDSEIGLQIALLNMDYYSGKVGDSLAGYFSRGIRTMVDKFDEAGISLYAITTADGFREAMRTNSFLIAEKSDKLPELEIPSGIIRLLSI